MIAAAFGSPGFAVVAELPVETVFGGNDETFAVGAAKFADHFFSLVRGVAIAVSMNVCRRRP